MSVTQFGIAFVVLLFAAGIGGVAYFQNTAIYKFTAEPGVPSDYELGSMREITFANQNGDPLRAWYALPHENLPMIISFYGNFTQFGPSVQRMQPLLDKGLGLAMIEYRGSGGNANGVGETGFANDARIFYDQLDSLTDSVIPNSQRIIHGFSLGSSIATHLAETRPAAGLVLESSFDSLCRFQTQRLRGFPMCKLMWRERHDNALRIGNIEMPVLIVHGANDASIPLPWAVDLFDAAAQPKEMMVIDKGGHSNLFEFGLGDRIEVFANANAS